jgi:hypothetical protein
MITRGLMDGDFWETVTIILSILWAFHFYS